MRKKLIAMFFKRIIYRWFLYWAPFLVALDLNYMQWGLCNPLLNLLYLLIFHEFHRSVLVICVKIVHPVRVYELDYHAIFLCYVSTEDMSYGCKELRSKRYISDGFCTATKPITEVVCTGSCLPASLLPWYAEYVKLWARTKVSIAQYI